MSEQNNVDLLKTGDFNEDIENKLEQKPKILKKFLGYSAIFIFTFLFVFTSQIIVSDQSSTSWMNKIPVLKQIKSLVEGADRDLKGEENDRINILLLGMGGKKHEGGYLTDTIILASLEPSTKKVALVSIPRDLAIPVEGMGLQKINAINAYAEAKEEGSGSLAAAQAVSDVLGIPVDYYLRLDFEGFVNIINELGGINIYVDNTLDDYSYPAKGQEDNPDYNARYEHLHIEKGWQKMDGDLALKYARSRHAAGAEGSDFARAKRQQKIIEAVKDEVISMNLVLRPMTISNITNELESHVNTNLKIWEIMKLWSMFKDTKKEDITNKVLDNSSTSLLVDSISSAGAYILVPRSGDFSEIQYFINTIFTDAPVATKTNVSNEKASVEVRNGTWINGLASKVALDLEKYGFTIVRIGNSNKQNVEKSVIYDLTYGEKQESLSILKNRTLAEVSLSLPPWLSDEISHEIANEKNPIKPDFLLIVGRDADNTQTGIANPVN